MKHTNRFLTAIALLLAALLISGLALAAEEPAEETETSPIKSIELKLAETELVLDMDESTRAVYAFTMESSNRILIKPEKEGTQPEYDLLRFVSSNEKVATSGKNLYAQFAYFEYKGVGEAEVKVQALSAAGKVLAESNAVKVTVKECPVEEMIVDPLKEKLASLSLNSDDFDLHDYVTVLPSGATYSDFTWSIADPSIVRVDKEGNLYALKLGETTITITSEGKDKDGKQLSAVIPVKVVAEPVTKITINPDTFTLVEGGKHLWLDEYITVEPEGQAAKDYSFLTSDRDVATVDPNALGIEVTPQGAGEATITVTALFLLIYLRKYRNTRLQPSVHLQQFSDLL